MPGDFAMHLPVQILEQVLHSELDPSYAGLMLAQKAERLESLAEMRSVSSALSSILPGGLAYFKLPEGMIIARPVGQNEVSSFKCRLNC